MNALKWLWRQFFRKKPEPADPRRFSKEEAELISNMSLEGLTREKTMPECRGKIVTFRRPYPFKASTQIQCEGVTPRGPIEVCSDQTENIPFNGPWAEDVKVKD